MDPDHLPSSPFHHRRSSARSDTQDPSEINCAPRADVSPVTHTVLPPWQSQDVAYADRAYVKVDPWNEASSSSIRPSSLLTSEPLNRSTSITIGKRTRSTSLPPVTPVKRTKHRHAPHTPSEPWNWMIREPKRERSKLERAEQQAVLLRQELEISRPRTSVIVASRGPPINVNTLKSLDANEILRNPQLRHDLLFDALAFRPVTLDPADPSIDSRASAAVADMYWESISDEMTLGCRCSRWRVAGVEGRIDAGALVAKRKEAKCVCGGWRMGVSEAEWWGGQASRWPSRLPELVKTLREILVSLMGSTTPCASHFAHSFSREALAAHEATCPTVTHALVPELYSALDPDFLTIQARRKCFNLDLFTILGEAIKVHCAPVRDALVNSMVETAFRGDIAGSLRKCFDCVEVMKLDIANHQVHALRPFLWKAAASHELSAFRTHLAAAQLPLLESSTRRWIRDASVRVIKHLPPARRSHLLASRSELVTRSVAEGFVSLVCGDWVHSAWPPTPQRRLGNELADTTPSIDIPECFKMDTRRIKNFHADYVDIALAHHITHAFQLYLVKFHPHLPKSSIHRHMLEIRRDIDHALDAQTPLISLAPCIAARLVRPDATYGETPRVVSHDEARVVQVMTPVFEHIMTPASHAYAQAEDQVRRAITMVLSHRLLPPAPPRPRREEEEAAAALITMEEDYMDGCGIAIKDEIRALTEKMTPIVAFNLKVFLETYQEKGMVVGV